MSVLTINHIIEIYDSFRDLFKNQKYEELVLLIINKSNNIFAGKEFSSVAEQAHGECDFIDNKGNKYDVKVVLNEEQGRLLGARSNDIRLWIQDVYDESNEYYEKCIQSRDLSFITETKFYKVMKERFESLAEDENGIMFIPFPITVDIKGSIALQFAVDFLQAVYSQLVDEGVVRGREMYFIYPSDSKNVFILRDGYYHREYIMAPELEDYVSFYTKL